MCRFFFFTVLTLEWGLEVKSWGETGCRDKNPPFDREGVQRCFSTGFVGHRLVTLHSRGPFESLSLSFLSQRKFPTGVGRRSYPGHSSGPTPVPSFFENCRPLNLNVKQESNRKITFLKGVRVHSSDIDVNLLLKREGRGRWRRNFLSRGFQLGRVKEPRPTVGGEPLRNYPFGVSKG